MEVRMLSQSRSTALVLSLVSWMATPTSVEAQMECDPCVVGVALDGPWERNDEIRTIFETEIRDLTEGTYDVRFPPELRRVGDWSLAGVAAGIDALLDDPSVDLLLTVGPVASTYAGRLGAYPKPVVAAFVLDPDIQGIPTATTDAGDLVSGITNLNYVMFPANADQNIPRLREITPFTRLTFLTSQGLADAVPELRANLFDRLEGLGVEPEAVTVGTSVDEAIAAIPADTEAVYVYPLIQLPQGDFERLVHALIDRRLPSFSYWGRPEVESGILASLYPGEGFDRLGRRVALNVQRILMGEDAGTLPVDFERRQRASLNVETARAIGVYPSWSVWTEVELVGERDSRIERSLDLAGAAREALEANLDVLARTREVEAGREETRIARSSLYPQLGVGGVTETIDADRAASFAAGPQRIAAVSASVSQLIYGEPTLANIEIQDQVQRSREEELEELRLDIVWEAAVGYLDVLRAKTFESIQRDNLAVTRSNLDLARVRQELGVARAAEVIRWEAEIANNRRDVISASATRNVAEIGLNRLLARPLEEAFRTVDADLEDPAVRTSAVDLEPYLGDPFSFDVYRDFMTTEALTHSPELQQLDAAIRAQDRALTSARRSFWAPTVTFTGEVGTVATGGAGSSFDFGTDLPLPLSAPDSLNWTMNVSASLPLFTGGARRAERARSSLELDRLHVTRRSVALTVEQRVRSALHVAGASFAGIELADDAAEAAERNLELVTDAYERGVASIIDLLDAQNQALVEREVAANAVFDYLIDLMAVQRAMGRFDFFTTADDHAAFMTRLNRHFAAAGLPARDRRR